MGRRILNCAPRSLPEPINFAFLFATYMTRSYSLGIALLPVLSVAQSGLDPDHVFSFLPTIWAGHAPYCLTVDPQDRPVIFGERLSDIPYDSRVYYVRALPNAEPDSSFDEEGFIEHNVCTWFETTLDVACLPDGRIMGMGEEDYNGYDNDGIYVQRLNLDGTLDTTFWGNGKFIFQWNGEYTKARAMTVQPDGGTVIAGLNNDYDGFLVRLDPTGAFDSDFGINGGVPIGVGDHFDEPADVCALPDGSLIVTGWWQPYLNANEGVYVLRVLPDGTVDQTYGDGGYTALHDTVMSWLPANIAAASDGSVYVASVRFSVDPDIDQLVVQHFLPDGTYDTAFGINGVRVIPVPGNYINQFPAGLAVLPNDLVVVTPNTDKAGLICLLPNGQFAQGFGDNGILLDPDFILDQTRNVDLAADSDGNVWILTGQNSNGYGRTVAYKVIMDLSVGTLDPEADITSPMLLGSIVTDHTVELSWRMTQPARLNIDLFTADGRALGRVWTGEAAVGDYRHVLQLPGDLVPGAYLLRFATGVNLSAVRFIKR